MHVAGGVLMLDDVRPAGGYDEAADKRVERDDRIRVEFERKDGNHQGQPPRVEVRIINGELVQTPVDPSS